MTVVQISDDGHHTNAEGADVEGDGGYLERDDRETERKQSRWRATGNDGEAKTDVCPEKGTSDHSNGKTRDNRRAEIWNGEDAQAWSERGADCDHISPYLPMTLWKCEKPLWLREYW
jgi:hypothetical protein